MIRESAMDPLYNSALTNPIHFCHRIKLPLVFYRVGLAVVKHLDPACLLRRCDSYFEIAVILFHISPVDQP